MSICYVTEFQHLATDAKGNILPAGDCDGSHVQQKFTFTATAGASAAFAGTTKFIRVSTDAAAFLKFGAAPTAVTATDIPVASGAPEYFGVKPGDKVSAVA